MLLQRNLDGCILWFPKSFFTSYKGPDILHGKLKNELRWRNFDQNQAKMIRWFRVCFGVQNSMAFTKSSLAGKYFWTTVGLWRWCNFTRSFSGPLVLHMGIDLGMVSSQPFSNQMLCLPKIKKSLPITSNLFVFILGVISCTILQNTTARSLPNLTFIDHGKWLIVRWQSYRKLTTKRLNRIQTDCLSFPFRAFRAPRLWLLQLRFRQEWVSESISQWIVEFSVKVAFKCYFKFSWFVYVFFCYH